MLSGSGPQGRDETLHGFSVFFHLAQHLSAQGIASFRFDDRGVGNSTGNFNESTLADHANDVTAILDYFSRRTEHRFERFILLGHSQGGIVASRVATTRRDVAKVILMAAPAVPLIDIVLYQVRHEYSQLPVNKAVVEEGVSAHNRLMWPFRKINPSPQNCVILNKPCLRCIAPQWQLIPQHQQCRNTRSGKLRNTVMFTLCHH